MSTWTIYMYTFPNGKRYIGKTRRTMSKRKGNAETWSGYRNCTLLWKAIQKYGVENIHEEIIVSKEMSDADAAEIERHYIELYRTNANRYGTEYGYNLTDGGEGVSGIKYTEEEHLRRVEQMRENGHKHQGVPLSAEHRKKLSEAKRGEKHPLYGKHMPESTKEKISKANSRENMSPETHLRRSASKKKPVRVTNNLTGEVMIFPGAIDAGDFFHVSGCRVAKWARKYRTPSIPYTFDYCSTNND